jgi:hypothetical protein
MLNGFGRKLRNPAFRLPIIAIVSLVLVAAGFVVNYATGNRYSVQTALNIEAGDFFMLTGEGSATEQGFQIRKLSPQGYATVVRPRINVFADAYTEVKWRIAGVQDQDIRLIWATRDQPETLKEAVIAHNAEGIGTIDLSRQADWNGFIDGIGFAIRGTLREPITLQRLVLQNPQTPSMGTLMGRLWNEWGFFEGWTQRSINFIDSTPRHALFPPVLAVAAWVALSIVLNLFWMLRHRQRLTLASCGVFFLLGWLALDIRWQWNLGRRLDITRTQFADKSWREKQQAGEDGALFRVIFEARQKLPAEPVRLFLITDSGEGNRYNRGRARYHLLPHNVYSSGSMPFQGVRPGDYILLLRPFAGIQYDHTEKVFKQNNRSLPVELVYASSMAGLFRINDVWR